MANENKFPYVHGGGEGGGVITGNPESPSTNPNHLKSSELRHLAAAIRKGIIPIREETLQKMADCVDDALTNGKGHRIKMMATKVGLAILKNNREEERGNPQPDVNVTVNVDNQVNLDNLSLDELRQLCGLQRKALGGPTSPAG